MSLSAAAEYNHSSQPHGRLRRLVASRPSRAVALIRLRADPPLAAASFPASACGHRSPDDHSTRAPKVTRRRCYSPAASPCDSRAEARQSKPSHAPRGVALTEACPTLAERGLPDFARAEARSRPAKPALCDPRGPKTAPLTQRLLRHTARPRPHRVRRAAPSSRAAETTPSDRARPALAPRTEVRDALDRSAPAKPSAQVPLGRTQPARPTHVTEVTLTRRLPRRS